METRFAWPVLGLTLALRATHAHADPPATSQPATSSPTPTITGPLPATVTPPAGTVGPSWIASISNASTSPDVVRLSLDEAVRRSLAQNPTVAIAEQEIRRAQALVEQVRSYSLPTLIGNLTYTRLDSDRVADIGGHPTVLAAANQLSGNITLAVPLFSPQRWAQWSHARDNVEVARATAQDARRSLAIATSRAYLAVAVQHRIVGTYQRAAASARAHADFAQSRFTGGVGNRLDVVRANQEFAADRALLGNQIVVLGREQEALGVLVGFDRPADALDEVPIGNGPSGPAAMHDAETLRSDVRAQASRVTAARATVRDDWADYMPTLLAVGQPFLQDPPTLTVPLTGWQAQLILSVPFYDGGLRYGLAHERDALLAEARIALEGTLRQARSDVRTALDEIRRASEAAAAAHESAQLAAEALQLADLAYRAGANTNLDVIDAERAARDAEASAHIADDNLRQARLDLLIATGHLP
jgi:outer membrane protein TolC